VKLPRIIVVGINTEVGKTVISAILTEALMGSYWKPVQCGLPEDATWVRQHVSSKVCVLPSSFSLRTPCSPHLAARNEGVRIEAKNLTLPIFSSPLVIEGTGGLLAPLNESETWADAAIHWNARWVLVHRHYLGSLNHFALTIESMKQRKIPLMGVIFNGEGDVETEEMLLRKADACCLGRLAWEKKVTSKIIQRIAKEWTQPLLTALGA
jgi:dethiobiotin synthetase